MGGGNDEHALPDQRNKPASQGEHAPLPTVVSSSHNSKTVHGGGDDIFVTANYSPTQAINVDKQSGISYISRQMANLGVEGYGRARTSSSGESGVAEISPGVEPQSVQTGYLTIAFPLHIL